jgi:CO/xanthine dehydrogenase FAD-binding subunit
MYYQPVTLDEALQIKAELGGAGHFVAGGTDLVVGMRKGKARPEHVVDLGRVEELTTLSEVDGRLRIGAGVTHARLEDSSFVALAAATATVGGPQIRNLGTVGGQIGTASPAGDVSVALLALRAECELVSKSRGRRRLPIDEMFVSYAKTALEPDELLEAVYVPLGGRSAFHKIGKRNAVAISVVVAAVSVGSGGEVGIGLGCVGPTPLRCPPAESYLAEHGLTEAAIAQAGELVEAYVEPIDDHRGSADYRRSMAGRLTQRLLRQVGAPRAT